MEKKLAIAVGVIIVLVVTIFAVVLIQTPYKAATSVKSQDEVTETITGVISDLEDVDIALNEIDTSLG